MKGVCMECNKPLSDENSFGHHKECAVRVHNREELEVNINFPFVIYGEDGEELNRFALKEEAEYYLHNVRNAELKNITDRIN